MKKLFIAALAATTALTGFVGTASAQPYRYHAQDRYRDSDRDGRPDYREWNRDRDRDGRPDQYDRRDNRRGDRWDHRRGDRQFRYYGGGYGWDGYRGRWRQGDRFTHYRNRAYYIDNYSYYGLPAPRPGYRYYRDDNGDVVMAAIASGIIGMIVGGALSDNDHHYRRY